MKLLLISYFLLLPIMGFSQTTPTCTNNCIVCNDQGCNTVNVSASPVQESGYTSVDIKSNNQDLHIQTTNGSLPVISPVRVNVVNGGTSKAQNVSVNLAATVPKENGGNIVLIGDNIKNLNVNLNGYTGKAGVSASQICANNFKSGKYGVNAQTYFLQQRAYNPLLSVNNCVQSDVDYLSNNNFYCNDSSYTALDSSNELNVQMVRQVSQCLAVVPQRVCYEKSYNLTCKFQLLTINPDTYNKVSVAPAPISIEQLFSGFSYAASDSWATDCASCYSSNNLSQCPVYLNVTKNGSNIMSFYGQQSGTTLSYTSNNGSFSSQINSDPSAPDTMTKNYQITQTQLNNYQQFINSQGNGQYSICSYLIDQDPEWSKNNNNYVIQANSISRDTVANHPGLFGGSSSTDCSIGLNNRNVNITDQNQIFWQPITSPVITEIDPPGQSTGIIGDRLINGTPFNPPSLSPYGDNASIQTNPQGWQLEVMPGYSQLCSPGFTYLTTETSNIVMSEYDPNQFTAQSYYCLNTADKTNCSNPPFCDDISNSANCRKVSTCQLINQHTCIDSTNSTNCHAPPFCDDPTSSINCSTSNYDQSCGGNNSAVNNFCQQDPNNQAPFSYVGTEPDPSNTIQSVSCSPTQCGVTTNLVNTLYTLDTITPTNGEDGTYPGQGIFFIYDANTITTSSTTGNAGAGGLADLTSNSSVRYCAKKRDYSTDPGTDYQNSPIVNWIQVNWSAFTLPGGGSEGFNPPYTTNQVQIFKKIDPAVRYLLKKELL